MSPDQPLLRARWSALLALAAGLAGVLAFPRFELWPAALLSVAGLSLAVHRHRLRTAAALGFVYGLGFFVPLLSWTGIYVGAAPWLILAVAESVYLAGLGALLALVQRLRWAPLWIACGWVLQEALRSRWPFGGFPWGRLAFSQADSPLRWFAALGGAPLLSFAVALAGAGLALAVGYLAGPRRRFRRRWLPLGVPAGVFLAAVVVLAGGVLSWPLGPAPDAAGPTSTVALIQGSVPDRGLAFEDRAREVLDNHLAQTRRLIDEVDAGKVAKPDLIVWPENASDVDPYLDAVANEQISEVTDAAGVPILVGAILQGPGPDHRRNAGILWLPHSGPGQQYVKRHPVPFAEYIPLRGLAERVSSAAKLVTQDMVPGHGTGLLRGGPYPIGDVICFEVAYDGLVQSSVAAGAQLLVVQTNNATFGHTAETYQQLAMSRLRAVETGRTVLQVATTGKSAVIGPDGGVRAESGALFTPAVLVATVPLRTGTTLAVRVGAVPEYLLAALAIGAAAWVLRRSSRRRSRPEPAPAPDDEMVTA